MRPSRAFDVNHHNHFAAKNTEANEASLAIVLSYVFTGDSEVVPNCIASGEVKPVVLDVQLALGFVPLSILDCIYKITVCKAKFDV